MIKKISATLGLSVLLALAGCSSVSLDEANKDGTLLGSQANQQAGDTQGLNRPQPTTVQAAAEDAITKGASFYFAFDQYEVNADDTPKLVQQATYLRSHPDARIRLEGNTDERGGREYNLALGQKRSEAVLQRLQLLGVPASQMEAVSFGKEKPRNPGHDEAAWAENRRVDLVYKK